jgi:hypothetical protein
MQKMQVVIGHQVWRDGRVDCLGYTVVSAVFKKVQKGVVITLMRLSCGIKPLFYRRVQLHKHAASA